MRLNIRPFLEAGVLRKRPNIKWGVDRGKNPPGSPWGEERDNDKHLRLAEKMGWTLILTQMASKWPKIIRDPVHNVISFEDTPGDRLLLNLINCKEFQRLRRIRQLGLSELVFPGANHTRFAHSIGVMRTAKKFLKRCKLLNHGLNDDQETFIPLRCPCCTMSAMGLLPMVRSRA